MSDLSFTFSVFRQTYLTFSTIDQIRRHGVNNKKDKYKGKGKHKGKGKDKDIRSNLVIYGLKQLTFPGKMRNSNNDIEG